MVNLSKKYKISKLGIQKSLKDQLIIDFAPLVKFIALKIVVKLPRNVELDDLISVGIIGLIDAIEKYDVHRQNKFKTYAEFRIRGSIMDELRKQDWFPRSVRDSAKLVEKAYVELEQKFNRSVSSEEVSKKLGVDLKSFYTLNNKIYAAMMMSIDEFSSENESLFLFYKQNMLNEQKTNPYYNLNQMKLNKQLTNTIKNLPEKEMIVLILYYFEECSFCEIAKILKLSESRISQIHVSALKILKKLLSESRV